LWRGKNPGDTYEGKFNGKEDAEKFGSPRARTQRKNELSGLRTREKLAWGIGRDEQLAHPLGKNPSDFFKSNTKPYPEAHFAVFPEDICIPRIKSSTPKEVCSSCGKARERITETSQKWRDSETKALDSSARNVKLVEMGMRGSPGGITNRARDYFGYEGKTIGWTKCDCKAPFNPGVVLDPFAGSGTVGKVALDLGRKAILIEINEDYRELQERRLSVHNPEWLEKYAIADAKENGIVPLTEF
jgi:hypothetical protein